MTAPDNIDGLVAQFVKLRDSLKAADDAHKAKTKEAREYKEQLEAKLLARLNEIGGNAVKTDHGTVHRTTKKTASIADGDAFRKFVQSQKLFDLVDWRANALAVEDYINEHHAPPPGVNYSKTYTVGVRRS